MYIYNIHIFICTYTHIDIDIERFCYTLFLSYTSQRSWQVHSNEGRDSSGASLTLEMYVTHGTVMGFNADFYRDITNIHGD